METLDLPLLVLFVSVIVCGFVGWLGWLAGAASRKGVPLLLADLPQGIKFHLAHDFYQQYGGDVRTIWDAEHDGFHYLIVTPGAWEGRILTSVRPLPRVFQINKKREVECVS